MSASSPPGWYPDPIADDLERWWDGDAWSESEFRFARSSGSHHDAGLDPFDGILGSIISGQWVGTMKSRLSDFAVSIGLPAVGAAIDPEPVPSELGDSVDGIDRDDVSMDGSASIGEPLAGGNMGDVLRIGDTVRRASGEWTPAVHLLLRTLRSAGVLDVPEPLGLDETGREVLSFISGENLADAPSGVLWDEAVLCAAGTLLRRVHDGSVALVGEDLSWRSPRREPAEVICHNDFAPYNLIVRDGALAGAIDFDFAAPGPRLWDLAYLGYRLAPYASDSPEAYALDRDRRLRLLLDAYGTDASPARLRAVMVEVLGALEDHTIARADATGRGDLYEHAEMYRADAAALRLKS